MKKVWLVFVVLLVAVDCHERHQNQEVNKGTQPLFELLPPASTQIDFTNALPVDARFNILNYEYYYNGGGVAVGDINNDGLDDIYFTANLGRNKLYINKGGFIFEDITATAGVEGRQGWHTGATMADVNADGFLDIYVCKSGRFGTKYRENELFINNGDGTFTEKASQYGLNDPSYSTQALFFDFDRDNDLDMFLVNHSVELLTPDYIKKWKKNVHPHVGDKLYENDKGYFRDISSQAGIKQTALGYGLGVAAGDINNDGYPDVYVTNDYTESDYLYINNGDKTFRESIKQRTRHISNFGMGVDMGDINNDGWVDIFTADMAPEDNYRQKTNMKSMDVESFYKAVRLGFHYQYMSNALQLNRGKGKFSEMAQYAGVSNTDWSWAGLFGDLDNDCWQDIYVTNGFRREFANKDFIRYKSAKIKQASTMGNQARFEVISELLDTLQEGKLSNYVYRNLNDLGFTNSNSNWGLDQPSFSNGASLADLDNDGDLDLIVNNIDHTAFVYKNNSSERVGDNYLQVGFEGPKGNPGGLGCKVMLKTEEFVQVRENFPTRGYQSSVPPYSHFGLGDAPSVPEVTVLWPDGNRQTLKNVQGNQRLVLKYDDAHENHSKEKNCKLLFHKINANGLNFKHEENDYNDFEREVLLPHKMSQFGPALAVADVDANGIDDVYIGGAKGQSGRLFFQVDNEKFKAVDNQPWQADSTSEDVDALFFDADNDGDKDLYVVSGGNEFAQEDSHLQDRLYLNDGYGHFQKSRGKLPHLRSSGGVVVSHDFDHDGDEDLFVGGRLTPQMYPTPASSHLLVNHKGVFTVADMQCTPEFEKLGMVTSALWTDYNQDGWEDLLIAGEWMPLTLFKNEKGCLTRVHIPSFESNIGWWNSLAQYDFDQDGDLDYVAGNLGLNYKYKADMDAPFHVYANDFDENGSLDIVLGYDGNGELYPLRGLQCSSQQMPFIKSKFKSYHEFGKATLKDIYDESKLETALHYGATNFANSYIENMGNGTFNWRPLPNLAQLSAINSMLIQDFDGDSIPDLIIAGNNHAVEVETIRNDASYGLFLKGDGKGKFTPVDMHVSGLELSGDVKKISLLRTQAGQLMVAAVNDDSLKVVKIESKINN